MVNGGVNIGFDTLTHLSYLDLMKTMTPEGLALGAQMAFSKKRKREIEDESYHR